jgi:hypothetical protein
MHDEFLDYVLGFYGTGGIYEMDPPMTRKEALAALEIRIRHQKEFQYRADSTDRELVRDLVWANRGEKDDLEYECVLEWE